MALEDATARIAGVFGRAAATYDTVIPFFAHFGRRLVEVAELQPGERVLDLGAGRGASAFPAAERVGDEGRVVAIDLSLEMIELINKEAARRGTTNLTANVANAHDFAFEEPFDVIVSGSVLHLVPDPAAATRSMHGALRSGGRCVVSHPTGGGKAWGFFGEVIKGFADRVARPLERPPESPRDLLAVLEQAGFE
ncbi:MAG: methyltransferase domain-containing protein, partial [Actinobacteria bacterium]|nr:methyltransferase domain-containing protein [Actinomycetota bacterium]